MMPVLFENEDVVVVAKPEGVATIPGAPGDDLSVLARLEAERGEKLYIVHRLDKDVSGVLLFARHADAHRFLNTQFESRQVHKTYLAAVQGGIREAEGVIDAALREFGSGRVGVDEARGKPAVTRFEKVERLRKATLLHVYPLTGRRHQIRVHLYSISHPILGDRRYGDKAEQSRFPRLMLHALRLTFPLPSGETVTVEAPPPDSFESVMRRLALPNSQ